MVSYSEHPLRKAMAQARDAGMAEADVRAMVTDIYNPAAEAAPANGGGKLPVYDDLPKGGICIPDVVKKKGVSRRTVHNWVNSGKLECLGRLKAPAPGGGYTIVSEAQVQRLIDAPRNKGGRPKK